MALIMYSMGCDSSTTRELQPNVYIQMPLHVCIFPQAYASTNETPLACLSLESNFNSLQMLFQAMLVKNYHTNTPIQNQAYFTYWSNWDIAYLFAMKIQERQLLSDLVLICLIAVY
jgi:hypothetical protein